MDFHWFLLFPGPSLLVLILIHAVFSCVGYLVTRMTFSSAAEVIPGLPVLGGPHESHFHQCLTSLWGSTQIDWPSCLKWWTVVCLYLVKCGIGLFTVHNTTDVSNTLRQDIPQMTLGEAPVNGERSQVTSSWSWVKECQAAKRSKGIKHSGLLSIVCLPHNPYVFLHRSDVFNINLRCEKTLNEKVFSKQTKLLQISKRWVT